MRRHTRYHPVPAAVAAMHGIEPAALLARSRHQEVVEAGWVAVWILYRQGFGWSAIGRLMHRDHSSVAHAWRGVEADPQLRRHAQLCYDLLGQLAEEAAS